KALRFAKSYSVYDGSVIEFVGNNGVLFIEQRLEKSTVGVKSGSVQNRVLHAEKFRGFLLQFFMNVLCSADEANRRHTVTVGIYRSFRSLCNFRMRTETEIIIGTKI